MYAAACTTSAKVWSHEVPNKLQKHGTDQPQERYTPSSTPTRHTPSICHGSGGGGARIYRD